MKPIIYFLLLLAGATSVWSQMPPESCGTVLSLPDGGGPAVPDIEQSQMVNVPLQIHIIRTSGGATSVSYSDIQNEISLANLHYSGTNLSFSECGPVNFIDNSSLYSYSYNNDLSALLQHQVPNVLNVYYANTVIAESGNSAGGYAFFPWDNSPPASSHHIMIAANQSGNGSTLSHEIGHFFGLVHTHETASGVEYVNQSNCQSAGDFVCDTPADPNLASCTSSSCQYLPGFGSCPSVDPLGWAYAPLTNNIMSYASSSCRNALTSGQKNRASAFQADRSYLQCTSGSSGGNTPCNSASLSTDCAAPSSGSLTAATSSGVPIPSCSGYTSSQANDHWYDFVATNDTAVIALGCSGNLDGVLALYTGSCSNPSFISCVDNGGGAGQGEALVMYNLTVGQSYFVRIYEYNGSGNGDTYSVCIAFPSGGGGSNTADPAVDQIVADHSGSVIYPGDDVDLEAYIKNVGSSDITDPIYIDYKIDGVVVGSDPINGNDLPMAPGGTEKETYNNYNFSAPGTYQYCVEIQNHSQDANTSNNTLCIPVQVASPSYQINLSASPVGGGAVTGNGSFPSGTPHTVSAIPNSGWNFSGWTENGVTVSTNNNYSFSVVADRSLVAEFSEVNNPTSYTVSLSAVPGNGGTLTGGGTYTAGDTAFLAATPSSGWSFDEWRENGVSLGTNPNISLSIFSNRVIEAYFSSGTSTCTVSVSANPSNGGVVSGAGNYICGLNALVSATASPGWQFDGWIDLTGSTIPPPQSIWSVTVTSNLSLIANFVPMVGASEANFQESSLRIFPNPSHGKLSLQISTEIPDVFDITVVDARGQELVKRKSIQLHNAKIYELDLSKVGSGIYFVWVQGKDQAPIGRRVLVVD